MASIVKGVQLPFRGTSGILASPLFKGRVRIVQQGKHHLPKMQIGVILFFIDSTVSEAGLSRALPATCSTESEDKRRIKVHNKVQASVTYHTADRTALCLL